VRRKEHPVLSLNIVLNQEPPRRWIDDDRLLVLNLLNPNRLRRGDNREAGSRRHRR
jgi:hypothetical protein